MVVFTSIKARLKLYFEIAIACTGRINIHLIFMVNKHVKNIYGK